MITINLELADRFIPAYCSISILKWDRAIVKEEKSFNTLLNPGAGTNIEPFLSKKHGIYDKDVVNAPYLYVVWHRIYDLLEDELVIIDNATSSIKAFQRRAIIDGLLLPDFNFICLRSLFNKSYKYKKNFQTNIPNIKKILNINTPNYNAYYDAYAMKQIVDYCLLENLVYELEDLYNLNNFVVGRVENNKILNKDELNIYMKNNNFFKPI